MTPSERQRRVDAVREYVARAAAGISIGSGLMIFAPTEITGAIGLHDPGIVAAKLAIIAAAVWAAARFGNITVR